tara:strand:- start:766 stop:921 length:156 start_codon:yes stop_codon:yes gene_type:complete
MAELTLDSEKSVEEMGSDTEQTTAKARSVGYKIFFLAISKASATLALGIYP